VNVLQRVRRRRRVIGVLAELDDAPVDHAEVRAEDAPADGDGCVGRLPDIEGVSEEDAGVEEDVACHDDAVVELVEVEARRGELRALLRADVDGGSALPAAGAVEHGEVAAREHDVDLVAVCDVVHVVRPHRRAAIRIAVRHVDVRRALLRRPPVERARPVRAAVHRARLRPPAALEDADRAERDRVLDVAADVQEVAHARRAAALAPAVHDDAERRVERDRAAVALLALVPRVVEGRRLAVVELARADRRIAQLRRSLREAVRVDRAAVDRVRPLTVRRGQAAECAAPHVHASLDRDDARAVVDADHLRVPAVLGRQRRRDVGERERERDEVGEGDFEDVADGDFDLVGDGERETDGDGWQR